MTEQTPNPQATESSTPKPTALITGGAGFIGKYVARQLVAEGWQVVAMDTLNPQVHSDPDASRAAFPGVVIESDVADADAWAAIERPDVVIHLAAETGTAQSMYETERYRRTNVHGTELAGVAAKDWGVPLIALSSRAVYGEGRYRNADGSITFGAPQQSDAVPEDSRETDAHAPVSVYGETKSEGEAILAPIAQEVPVSIIRPQNVIGRGQALHNPYTGVLAAFLARLREGRPLSVYGDGNQTRDFVHVSDLANLIVWLVANPPAAGEALVLNCGTGVRTTLNELAEFSAAGSPSGTTVIEHVQVHRAGDIDHACADLTKGRSLGVPEPKWSTADAVADFIRWGWDKPGTDSSVWDLALDELSSRGLTS